MVSLFSSLDPATTLDPEQPIFKVNAVKTMIINENVIFIFDFLLLLKIDRERIPKAYFPLIYQEVGIRYFFKVTSITPFPPLDPYIAVSPPFFKTLILLI